ncbi:MAG: hypothetical protein RIT04_610 [Candidatus Parcubacteria bacterium]|jgi:hypothetical protein
MAVQKYIPALLTLVAVAVFHNFGAYLRLYFVFPWYDIPMHFLGGLWVGLTAVWALEVFFGKYTHSFLRSLVWVLSAVLCFAVVWEMFEFFGGINNAYTVTAMGLTFWADSIKDICMGLLGGILAFIPYYIRTRRTARISNSIQL